MENCIFCKIIKDEIPCYKVWEDEEAMAFLNVKPHKIGHVLLVPKKHDKYLFDLDDESFKDLVVKSKPIASALKKAFKPKSGKVCLLVMGMGVQHVHLHLIPLDKETDVNADSAYYATEEELKNASDIIKEVL